MNELPVLPPIQYSHYVYVDLPNGVRVHQWIGDSAQTMFGVGKGQIEHINRQEAERLIQESRHENGLRKNQDHPA